MFDSGAIDANGVARTNSPPCPGLSKSGQVMIARASQPMQQVRIDVTGQLTFTAMKITALGFSVSGGLVGEVVNTGIAATLLAMRSADRRVGEGCVSTCKSWWAPVT